MGKPRLLPLVAVVVAAAPHAVAGAGASAGAGAGAGAQVAAEGAGAGAGANAVPPAAAAAFAAPNGFVVTCAPAYTLALGSVRSTPEEGVMEGTASRFCTIVALTPGVSSSSLIAIVDRRTPPPLGEDAGARPIALVPCSSPSCTITDPRPGPLDIILDFLALRRHRRMAKYRKRISKMPPAAPPTRMASVVVVAPTLSSPPPPPPRAAAGEADADATGCAIGSVAGAALRIIVVLPARACMAEKRVSRRVIVAGGSAAGEGAAVLLAPPLLLPPPATHAASAARSDTAARCIAPASSPV